MPVPPEARVILAGLRVAVSPEGEIAIDRVTFPEKPPRLVSVIVEELDPPLGRVSPVGLAERLNPTTLTVKIAEFDSRPLVPVTLTV